MSWALMIRMCALLMIVILAGGCSGSLGKAPSPAKKTAAEPLATRRDSQKYIGPVIRQNFNEPVLGGPGARIGIRKEADTWQALREKLKPDFTWRGRDMMWISADEDGKPIFTMDRAYEYRPQGRPGRWVLITLKDGQFDEWFRALSGCSLRGVAKLHQEEPAFDYGSGHYAIVKATDPEHGTVYEVGWQSLTALGTSLAETERRLYVLKDGRGNWHFIGEGPTNVRGKSGYCRSYSTTAKSSVEWTRRPKTPVRIKFTITNSDYEWRSSDDLAREPPPPPPRRDKDIHREAVLEGGLPAELRWAMKRRYLLAQEGDTLEGIAKHLASWMGGWGSRRYDDWETILGAWRERLTELNPDLRDGQIPVRSRVWLPTWRERKTTEKRTE